MREHRNISIIIINLISTVVFGQTEMKYNYNSIDTEFVQTNEITSLFKNRNDDAKIQIIAEIENDSLFSIYVKNNLKDTLNLSLQDSHLKLIQEAKDINGNWKPIEYWSFSSCGNSYISKKMAPEKIIKTESKKYSGKFKTEIRFKLLEDNEVFYSNSIICKINQSQFIISEELKNHYSYSYALKVSNQALAERLMFLEPNAAKEILEKQKKYMEWVAEQNKKRKEIENKN